MSCKVIGVLEAKGTSGFGQDQDNVVLMPLSAFQRRIAGDRDIDTIYVAAADGVATSSVQADIETILRETRRIAPDADDNFDVRDMTQIADAMTSATTTMTGMLGAVAGVSLLVGGIGIMNIMLVSVTERTREIGIRLAIGAHEKHILDPVPGRGDGAVAARRADRHRARAGARRRRVAGAVDPLRAEPRRSSRWPSASRR